MFADFNALAPRGFLVGEKLRFLAQGGGEVRMGAVINKTISDQLGAAPAIADKPKMPRLATHGTNECQRITGVASGGWVPVASDCLGLIAQVIAETVGRE